MKHVKCVFVGDSGVGKSSFFGALRDHGPRHELRFRDAGYWSDYAVIEDSQALFQLWDTVGSPEQKRTRQSIFPQTDLFVILFSLVDPKSLENVQNEWVPEVKEHFSDALYILVGTKSDLRDESRSQGLEPVPRSKIEEVKEAISAQAYVECSSKLQHNLEEVLDTAFRVLVSQPPPPPEVPETGEEGEDLPVRPIKCTIVGDSGVGKTCLVLTVFTNEFPVEDVPVCADHLTTDFQSRGTKVHYQIWDTAGGPDYKAQRQQSYPETDVFLILFSLVEPKSLENVQNEWVPELKECCPNALYVLAGTKSDLRDEFAEHEDEYRSQGWEPVLPSKIEEVKEAINAQAYLECSSKTGSKLRAVVRVPYRAVLGRLPAAPAKVKKADED